MKLKFLTLALGLATAGAVMAAPAAGNNNVQQAGNNMGVTIGTYAPYTWQMMSNYSPVGREMYILKNRQSGHLANHALYFGGYAKADAMWQIASKTPSVFVNPVFFGPDGSDTRNTSDIQLTDISLLMTADINNWATVYMQLGGILVGGPGKVTNTIDRGSSVTATINRNSAQFQQGYLLLGDLNQQPVYGFIGRKDIDFGYFGSVNMFSQPLNRELFAAIGNTVGVGYMQHGLDVVLSAMNGGQNGTNLYTSNSSAVNNFAVNASYGNHMKGVDWRVGAGYLNGVAKEFDRTDITLISNGKTNGAWDINGQLAIDNFDVLAEYTATTNKAAVFVATVEAWNIGVSYNFPFMGRQSKVSFGYSRAQGIDLIRSVRSSNGFTQYVVGFRNEFMPNVWGGIAYAYNKGVLVALSSGVSRNNVSLNNVFIGNSGVNNNTVLLDLTAAF